MANELQHTLCKRKRGTWLSSYSGYFLLLCIILITCYFLYKRDTRELFTNKISKIIIPETRLTDNASDGSVWGKTLNTREGKYELSDKFVPGARATGGGMAPMDITNSKNVNYLQRLARDLQHKLESVIPNNTMKIGGACEEKEARDNSCQKTGCLRLTLPKAPIDRIAQLVEPPHLLVNETYQEVLKSMGDSVPGNYNIILATAASSNHYEESKSLLSNLHAYVFPYLKNFTLIYYDLGLTKAERDDISNTCRCQVKDFPFSHFGPAFKILRCFAWKPVIINAHAPHCNILHWMDSSIRFYEDPSKLEELYRLTRSYGLQIGFGINATPRVTLNSMFHFFGDEACVYHSFIQSSAGASVYHNEPLIREAVLNPWTACAINESCMCPHTAVDVNKVVTCTIKYGKGYNFRYGQCHRFDQSALSIITRKIFQEKSNHIIRQDYKHFFAIRRSDKSLVKTPS